MKGTKFVAILLSLALLVGLAAPALAVPTFTDLNNHWAKAYIMDLADRGLFEGYGDGRVGPQDKVNYSAALSLCARMAVPDTDTRLQLAADRAAELDAIFGSGGSFQWFRKEAATCLELNIISHGELSALAAGRLNAEASRVDFAKYVVRAMGVEDMIRGSGDVKLSFADASSISASMRPYVDLLCQWGVVNGSLERDGFYYFRPDASITRAECAKMLSVAVSNIETRKISVELARFTKYRWMGGYIENVEPGEKGMRLLSLTDPFGGEKQNVTLPAGVSIYRHNLPVESPALQVGAFVRVCFAANGTTPESVRVTPSTLLSFQSGTCEELNPNAIIVGGQSYSLNRFTLVSAGGKSGDRNIIDYNANYTNVQLTHDANGTVVHMILSGGTRQLSGILTGVAVVSTAVGSRTEITVTGYNGESKLYQVPDSAAVTVGGAAAPLKEALTGKHVSLRVSDADPTELVAVEVEMNSRYIQGILHSVDAKTTPRAVQITPTGGTNTRYDLSSDCTVTYMNADATLEQLSGGTFVTARLEGGTITYISGYQAYKTTSGTLTAITYGDPTVLQVTPESGAAVTFSVPVAKLKNVTVTYNGKKSDITALRSGDSASITVLYNDVVEIDATAQRANVVGTLNQVTQRADGSVQLSLLFADGSSTLYTAGPTATVTRNGAPATLNDIRAGSTVALVTNGSQALAIELSGSGQTASQIYGTVFQVDSANYTVTLLVKDAITGQDNLQNIRVPANISIQNVSGGSVPGLSRLEPGDILRIWGSYNSERVFVATLIVREK